MKKLILALAFGMSLNAAQALADDPSYGTLVMMRATNVFVPNGFDDNDEVEVVLEGTLPNTCYRLAFTQVERSASLENVYIVRQWARRFPGICLEIILPFTTEARLGQVPAGTFTIDVHGAAPKGLVVNHTTSVGPDDYLYAPVDTARVELDAATGQRWGAIEGRFTNTCMAWEEVKVIDSGETIEVLPIITMDDRDDCAVDEIPFSKRFALPSGSADGRHLMHVRSLNGKAVNAVFAVVPPR